MAGKQFIDVSVSGIQELNQAFKIMPAVMVNKIIRKAVRRAAVAFKAGMKRNLVKSEDTKELQKSVSISTKTKGTFVSAAIGPDYKKIKGKPHAHLVEFGHRIAQGGTLERQSSHKTGASKATGIRGGGADVGFVPGRPFARPTLDAMGPTIMKQMEFFILEETEKEMNRILGQAG
jgi:HK97 gp10 family phage protein